MKVRMLTVMAGTHRVWQQGEVYEIPRGEAKRLIKAGTAELATDNQPAVAEPVADKEAKAAKVKSVPVDVETAAEK